MMKLASLLPLLECLLVLSLALLTVYFSTTPLPFLAVLTDVLFLYFASR